MYKANLTDTKGDIDNNTMVVGDIDAPLTSIGRPSRQKTNKKTLVFTKNIGKEHIR